MVASILLIDNSFAFWFNLMKKSPSYGLASHADWFYLLNSLKVRLPLYILS